MREETYLFLMITSPRWRSFSNGKVMMGSRNPETHIPRCLKNTRKRTQRNLATNSRWLKTRSSMMCRKHPSTMISVTTTLTPARVEHPQGGWTCGGVPSRPPEKLYHPVAVIWEVRTDNLVQDVTVPWGLAVAVGQGRSQPEVCAKLRNGWARTWTPPRQA